MLAALLPLDIVVVVATDAMQTQRLSDKEEACVANAMEQRRREFRSGRNAAKMALKQMDCSGEPILLPAVGSRRPVWPRGFVGSITHTKGFCAAAVADAGGYAGLGIDVEPRTPMREGVVSRICTEREREWIAQQPDDHRKPDWGKTIFCIKETVYKVFNPIHGSFLGFQEADIELSPANESFLARVHQRGQDIQRVYSGRFGMDEHYIYASTILRV